MNDNAPAYRAQAYYPHLLRIQRGTALIIPIQLARLPGGDKLAAATPIIWTKCPARAKRRKKIARGETEWKFVSSALLGYAGGVLYVCPRAKVLFRTVGDEFL
jgi:hypothetical protein